MAEVILMGETRNLSTLFPGRALRFSYQGNILNVSPEGLVTPITTGFGVILVSEQNGEQVCQLTVQACKNVRKRGFDEAIFSVTYLGQNRMRFGWGNLDLSTRIVHQGQAVPPSGVAIVSGAFCLYVPHVAEGSINYEFPTSTARNCFEIWSAILDENGQAVLGYRQKSVFINIPERNILSITKFNLTESVLHLGWQSDIVDRGYVLRLSSLDRNMMKVLAEIKPGEEPYWSGEVPIGKGRFLVNISDSSTLDFVESQEFS